jgi:glycerol-3-phosphate acyltransferase PlsY
VFAVDIAKGAWPVLFLPPLILASDGARVWWAVACGVAAIIGHTRPIFLGFGKGGKGVATACGVFLALAPLQTALTLLIFIVVVLSSGYVSLASLTGAIALPVLIVVSAVGGARSPLFYVAVLTSIFVFWTHRGNIERLQAGTEYRFGRAANFGRRPSLAIGVGLLILAAAFLAAGAG